MITKSKQLEANLINLLEQCYDKVNRFSPDWLLKLRQEGATNFEKLGVPSTRNEEWKYTNLKGLAEHTFELAEPSTINDEVIKSHINQIVEGPKIVISNGRFDENLSTGYENIPGITICSLAEAIELKKEAVEPHLGQIAKIEEQSFASMNTALFEDGLFIHCEKSAELADPIQVLYMSTNDIGTPTANNPRNLIIMEQNSRVNFIETYASTEDQATFSNCVTEIVIRQDAHLEHTKIQCESEKAYHIAHIELHQEQKSNYVSNNLTFGGLLVRNDHNVWLGGEHIECTLDGVYVGNQEQVIDNHTKLDHAFPNCNSYQIYKGILNDKAAGVFNGKIFVHQDAQKTDAKQTNQALLLSKTATIDTKPQLEIFADDVKCTHGATIGQLEQDALFYLKSRGIPQEQAQSILVYAFASEVIEKVSCEPIKNDLENLLYNKLRSNF